MCTRRCISVCRSHAHVAFRLQLARTPFRSRPAEREASGRPSPVAHGRTAHSIARTATVRRAHGESVSVACVDVFVSATADGCRLTGRFDGGASDSHGDVDRAHCAALRPCRVDGCHPCHPSISSCSSLCTRTVIARFAVRTSRAGGSGSEAKRSAAHGIEAAEQGPSTSQRHSPTQPTHEATTQRGHNTIKARAKRQIDSTATREVELDAVRVKTAERESG